MPIAITGKRIIVTGGARGIAAAAVEHFVEEGATVASFDIRAAGQEVADRLNAAGPGRARFWQLDVSDRAAVGTSVDAAVDWLGGIDALFNIAAIERSVWAADLSVEDWTEILRINVIGVTNMCHAVFPHMKAGGGGAIVNFASDVAFSPYREGAHYSASKGAVVSYTRTLAAEWGPHNIRANCFMPFARTPMYEERLTRLTPEEAEAMTKRVTSMVPLGRFGDAKRDIAPVLAFLASDAASYVSAQNIGVSGGGGWGR